MRADVVIESVSLFGKNALVARRWWISGEGGSSHSAVNAWTVEFPDTDPRADMVPDGFELPLRVTSISSLAELSKPPSRSKPDTRPMAAAHQTY